MKILLNTDPKLTIEDIGDILPKPVIARVVRFDAEGLENLQEDISDAHCTGQPVIPVIIDSYGGSPYTCLAMIAALEDCHLPVATICTGKAMSAGACLFAFGTEGYRYMHPAATMMLHDVSDNPDGKLEELKVDVRHLEHLNKTIYKRMARHLGHAEDFFLKLLKQGNHLDLFLTAKEAKRHRIVNHLKVPSLEVSINVNYRFK